MTQGANNWADATLITPGYTSDPTPTAGLTMEAGEPNTSKSRTAWWKFTATSTRQLIIDLSQSIYPGDPFDADTYLSIFTGSTVDALTLVTSDDDGAGIGYLSRLVFKNPVAGTTYYVQAALYTTADDIDYVLTLNEASVGDWQDDAAVEWHTTALTSTPTSWQGAEATGATWQAASTAVWAASPIIVDTSPSAGAYLLDDGIGTPTADWYHSWLTLSRAGDGGNTVTQTTIPADSPYYTDPHVVGIEWEPATVPVTQRLTVRIQNSATEATILGSSPETYTVKAAPGSGSLAPYHPGGQSAAAVLGMATLGTITTPAAVELVVTDPAEFPISGDYSLPIAAVDQWAVSGTAPAHDPSGVFQRRWPIRATLEGAYRPRYRLIYDTKVATTARVTTWVRTVQRGDKHAGAPRTVQNNSQQASLRNIGFR